MAITIARFISITFYRIIKSRVYKTKLRNLEDLRYRLLEKSALIEPDFSRNVMTSFYDLVAQCQTVNSAHLNNYYDK